MEVPSVELVLELVAAGSSPVLVLVPAVVCSAEPVVGTVLVGEGCGGDGCSPGSSGPPFAGGWAASSGPDWQAASARRPI